MRASLLLPLLALCSCAGVTHTRIPILPPPIGAEEATAQKQRLEHNAAAEAAADGVRYYGSSLYLLINSNGKGGIEWRLLELPDQTKLMSAKPYNYLASLDTTLWFDSGVLRQSHELADGTVVPRAAIEAATEIAGALAKVALMADFRRDPPGAHRIHLYKLVFTSNGIELHGNKSHPIRVTIDPEVAQ